MRVEHGAETLARDIGSAWPDARIDLSSSHAEVASWWVPMRNISTRPDSPQAMAEVLALVVAVQPMRDARQTRMLRELDAFRRIGMSETDFEHLVVHYRQAELAQHGYPHADDLELIDELLDSVHDEKHRLVLCRMASCLITADGHIDDFERALYDRMLLRWGYTRTSVSRAILEEHVQ
jgi:hypothetical protein